VTVVLLPLISTPNTNAGGSSSSSDTKINKRDTFVIRMVESILLVMSDALVMNVATREICSSLLKMLDTLCDEKNENTEGREVLTPILHRMVNILLKTSEESNESQKKTNEHLKKYLILLDNTDKENNSHKEDMNIQDQASSMDSEFRRLEV
jgi:hypothetical protein